MKNNWPAMFGVLALGCCFGGGFVYFTKRGDQLKPPSTPAVESAPQPFGRRDIAHPTKISLPVASLTAPKAAHTVVFPVAELRLSAVLLSEASDWKSLDTTETVAGPARSLAPVSSERDEAGAAMSVQLAAVPGLVRYLGKRRAAANSIPAATPRTGTLE